MIKGCPQTHLEYFWYHSEISRALHTCHRKKSLHPLEAKRVQLLCMSSHIENGFLFERENSE